MGGGVTTHILKDLPLPTRSIGVMSCDCQPTAAGAVVSAGAVGSGVDGVRVLVRVDARRRAVEIEELRKGAAASPGRRSSNRRGIDQGGSILWGLGVGGGGLRPGLAVWRQACGEERYGRVDGGPNGSPGGLESGGQSLRRPFASIGGGVVSEEGRFLISRTRR